MILFNTKHWPLVYFYTDEKAMNDDDFEEYKKTYLQILLKCKKEKTKIILIADINNQKNLQLKYVFKQAQFNSKIEKFNKLFVTIACIYLKDKSMKKILNLYFSICKKPYCPYKICANYKSIDKFIKDELNKDYDTSIFIKKENDISCLQLYNQEYSLIKETLREDENIKEDEQIISK